MWHSHLSVQASSSYHCQSHQESVCILPLLLLLHYLSWIRFLAETDKMEMALFVAVTTNSVSSWALLPVMVLASTPKTGTVILGGLFHESFVSVTYRLVVCCLLLVVRAWLTNAINFILSFYPTHNGSILFICFGLSAHMSSIRESEVRFSL